jgi:hypothetical protein
MAPEAFTLYFRLESDELTDESRALLPGVLKAVAGAAGARSGRRGAHRHDRRAEGELRAGPRPCEPRAHALVGAGVDAALIDISSLGESDLRIRTADNVLESRNRRVEISVAEGARVPASEHPRRRALGQWPWLPARHPVRRRRRGAASASSCV